MNTTSYWTIKRKYQRARKFHKELAQSRKIQSSLSAQGALG
jgi:hypothetical protein